MAVYKFINYFFNIKSSCMYIYLFFSKTAPIPFFQKSCIIPLIGKLNVRSSFGKISLKIKRANRSYCMAYYFLPLRGHLTTFSSIKKRTGKH